MGLRRLPIHLLYPRIEIIIAVSEGVRQDTLAVSGVSPAKVVVVKNPVITGHLLEVSEAPDAMASVLEDPPHGERLRQAVREYSAEYSARLNRKSPSERQARHDSLLIRMKGAG
jgi:hypothetical protein